MRIEVKVPQLPESVSEATLVSWHKKPGDAVARDENLIDVETDKVVLELPAPGDGVLVELKRPDGSTVTSNEVIAIIDTEAKGAAVVAAAPKAAESKPAAAAAPKAAASAAAAPAQNIATALPAARKILAEQGVDAAAVEGTGRGGRVTKGDALAAVDARSAPATAPVPAAKAPPVPPVQLPTTPGSRPEQRVPMSRLRQRVAERLVQSQATAAILTTFNEVNMQPVIDLRNRYKERFEKEHGVKLGFMGFFVKAV
ncbi:MAG: biotin/lipoyl-containing protein, partial [Betaproteobacteria bacterium]